MDKLKRVTGDAIRIVKISGDRPQQVKTISSGGGGGDEQLFVFCDSPGYLNAGAKVGDSNYLTASAVYYGAALVSGATVTLYTYGDYILDGVTGWKSGDTISFTTVQRGTYTFTMPSESVNCTLLYDD